MFVVNLIYRKPIEEVEKYISDHRKFLDRYYDSGVFLASGPKNPRSGGVILASGKVSKEVLEKILAEDPFNIYCVAKYEIIDFTPIKFASGLKDIL